MRKTSRGITGGQRWKKKWKRGGGDKRAEKGQGEERSMEGKRGKQRKVRRSEEGVEGQEGRKSVERKAERLRPWKSGKARWMINRA